VRRDIVGGDSGGDRPEALTEIAIQVPGKWSAVPTIGDVAIEVRPRDSSATEEYQRLSAGQLVQRHLDELDAHTCVVRVSVASGSTVAAVELLKAGAALLETDGAAVKVEGAALVRSKEEWAELAQRPGAEGLYYAFVAIEASDTTATSRGMEALGLGDALVCRAPGDDRSPTVTLQSFLHYAIMGRPDLRDGDLYCASTRYEPVYRLDAEAGRPDNPYGRWRLSAAGPTPVIDLDDVVAVGAAATGSPSVLTAQCGGGVRITPIRRAGSTAGFGRSRSRACRRGPSPCPQEVGTAWCSAPMDQ